MSATGVPADVPEGFERNAEGGEFIAGSGPLYLRQVGSRVQLGFRVESRHTNGIAMCHGGMMATFCDMLLPLTARRVVAELRRRVLPTVSLQLDYLAPSRPGAWVQGEAQVLRTTRALVFVQGLVVADEVPVARVSGVLKIGPTFGPAAD